MTDTRSSQDTPVFATTGAADIQSPQVAVYFLTKDAALGAQVSQLVVYAAETEYELPISYHGWRVPALWGNPLFIEKVKW